MTDESEDPYAALDNEQKTAVRLVCEALVDGLREYAGMMERGEIARRDGPAALREFADTVTTALALKDQVGIP